MTVTPNADSPPSFVNYAFHEGEVAGLASYPLTDRLLVAATSGDTIWVWSLPDNFTEAPPLSVPEGRLRALELVVVDRTLVVVGAVAEKIRVWDPLGDWRFGHDLVEHPGGAYTLAATKIATRHVLLSGGGDGTLRMWDLLDGTEIGPPIPLHQQRVRALALATLDGRQLAISGSDDGAVSIVDLDDWTIICEDVVRHEGAVFALAVTLFRGHAVVVSGGADGRAQVRDLSDPERPMCEPLVHTWASASISGARSNSAVVALATSEVGGSTVIVSGGDDGVLRIWDPTDGALVASVGERHSAPIVALEADRLKGRPVLFSGDERGYVLTWDLGWQSGPAIGRWARGMPLDLPDPRPLTRDLNPDWTRPLCKDDLVDG